MEYLLIGLIIGWIIKAGTTSIFAVKKVRKDFRDDMRLILPLSLCIYLWMETFIKELSIDNVDKVVSE